MAIPLDATVGGGSSNSYSTLSAADLYHANRISAEAWGDLDDDPKAQALIQATQLLDEQVTWVGWIATQTQALAWPRTGAYAKSGVYIQNAVIPIAVQWAVAEYALFLLTTQASIPDAIPAGLKALTAGSVKLEYDPNLTPPDSLYEVPSHVWSMMSFLSIGGGNESIVPLVRY